MLDGESFLDQKNSANARVLTTIFRRSSLSQLWKSWRRSKANPKVLNLSGNDEFVSDLLGLDDRQVLRINDILHLDTVDDPLKFQLMTACIFISGNIPGKARFMIAVFDENGSGILRKDESDKMMSMIREILTLSMGFRAAISFKDRIKQDQSNSMSGYTAEILSQQLSGTPEYFLWDDPHQKGSTNHSISFLKDPDLRERFVVFYRSHLDKKKLTSLESKD